MSSPNVNTLWGRIVAAELARVGIDMVCLAPGSRSTPLVIGVAEHEAIEVVTHLDERSAAFFALGRAKRTDDVTPLICTSGTAAAEFHPAVIEADRARVPLLVLSADRPPELQDSGANQTIDQTRLYGDAVRWFQTLPEPAAIPRKLRMLKTTVARAVATSMAVPPGPVHLNFPFRKPLAPIESPTTSPDGIAEPDRRAVTGRDAPYVRVSPGRPTVDDSAINELTTTISAADRGLIVAGPADWPGQTVKAITTLSATTGFPVLADPLSGLRYGDHLGSTVIGAGYDAYLESAITDSWPDPDIVIRFGAAPTSKRLQNYLTGFDARQVLIDPAGGWREATFSASDLVVADPAWVANSLADRVSVEPASWTDRIRDIESRYWSIIETVDVGLEGAILRASMAMAPDPATVFVSNSRPVRDLDRFGEPRAAALTVLGNRGASGIDGITSTALGAVSGVDEPLILLIGDIALLHDMNGLQAIKQLDRNVTIVLINNDGGGIFHALPIADFDPPFTQTFKTPHGLDFSAVATMYELEYDRTTSRAGFREAYQRAVHSEDPSLVEIQTDAAQCQRAREQLQTHLIDTLTE